MQDMLRRQHDQSANDENVQEELKQLELDEKALERLHEMQLKMQAGQQVELTKEELKDFEKFAAQVTSTKQLMPEWVPWWRDYS